ncbi:ESCRT-I complex subunit MVB12 [Schistosoma bovis]|uniref:ESCRT-I complex subunit MVB12 n=1 Tax=Schistosoma bovis TaxID=6184 RepID=A0A430Q1R1_SCHBO|nr:ESCRT-I complex subunit MVB12 [Schistosoma bovis]
MSSGGDPDSSCVITAVGFVAQAGTKQQKYEVVSWNTFVIIALQLFGNKGMIGAVGDFTSSSVSVLSGTLMNMCIMLCNCFTYHILLSCLQQFKAGQRPILVNLVLVDDGEHIPANHQAIYNTIDTGERALKRKILCAKFSPRSTTSRAITRIGVYSRPRTTTPGYTRIGDINSIVIYCKHTEIGLFNSERSSVQVKLPPSVPSRPSIPDRNGLHPSLPSFPSSDNASACEAFATTRRGTVHRM